MKTKAYLYIRCSTSMQSTDHQRKSLEDYCKRNDLKVSGIYEDAGISGMKHDREALNEMLADVRAGKIKPQDKIICYSIDRLGRSLSHLCSILSEMASASVHICSTSQGIDTGSVYGSMLAKFLGIIGEIQHENIVSNVKSGIARYRDANPEKPWGRRRVGFPVAECLELKRSGMSWSKLSKHAGVSASTLQRVLYPLMKSS